ncbi:MAG: hypothetical protein TR69_WS6001000648 [candidate division WS6 bacterium OLB20]|uniref:Uncharacterized protein n=1 Tax=candidate division WS6 bacterium OLB20 TaxID=1617426 RepID=A0A136LYB9_9BACT|nr:MAG: hypothetical protein TR69_WS6001000648 [candidate division WS6 bacterium OLB20]
MLGDEQPAATPQPTAAPDEYIAEQPSEVIITNTTTVTEEISNEIVAADEVLYTSDAAALNDIEASIVPASEANRNLTAGVIATSPAYHIDAWMKGEAAMPLVRRGNAAIRISNENGPVRRGDFLTAANVPGYAMKADGEGMILGRAMEDFDPAFFAGGDSEAVNAFFAQQKSVAYELIETSVNQGNLSEDQAELYVERIESEVFAAFDEEAEKERITGFYRAQALADEDPDNDEDVAVPDFVTGRIMMYVDSYYVGNDVFGMRSDAAGALQIESFSLANGDNLFEINDNPGSTTMRINVDQLVIAGALVVEGDLDVLGVFYGNEAVVNSLTIQRKLNRTGTEPGSRKSNAAGRYTHHPCK